MLSKREAPALYGSPAERTLMEFSVLIGQSVQGWQNNVISLLLQEQREERHGLLTKPL